MSEKVFILDAVRSPVGRIGGGLSGIRPDDLAAYVIAGLIDRSPRLPPDAVNDVWLGNGNGAGEENRNVARMAALLAGLPTTVAGATVNRLCGSGLDAVIQASREIAAGDADVVLAGGVESMSRAPWVVLKPDRPHERGHRQMHSTTLGWRLVNPAMPERWTIPLGEGAEILADRFDIGREEQDEFAERSHRKAAAAWARGDFDDEVIDVPGVDLTGDESVRPDVSRPALASLEPVFRAGGSVTAGNSSPMNDGAAALLLASERGVARAGRDPVAAVIGRGVSGIDPDLYGLGPVLAAERALARAGIGWADLDVIELNEAFAAQALACLRSWPDLDAEIVNPCGGAIALGHPIGASGARIMTTLVHELGRRGGRYGLATMCIGVGQGIAVVVEASPS
ncbi:MAG: acetyl-CoA C-acyltransferase [Actinomycetota bacterium]